MPPTQTRPKNQEDFTQIIREQTRAARLREVQNKAKIEREKARKKKAKKIAKKGNVTLIMRSRKLRIAWLLLIPTGGASIFYVHMHIFGRILFGDTFCKLGEEWTMMSKMMQTVIKIIEIVIIIFLDILLLVSLLLGVIIIGWIINNPITSASLFAGYGLFEILKTIYLPWL